jgi:hypothetical protein
MQEYLNFNNIIIIEEYIGVMEHKSNQPDWFWQGLTELRVICAIAGGSRRELICQLCGITLGWPHILRLNHSVYEILPPQWK